MHKNSLESYSINQFSSGISSAALKIFSKYTANNPVYFIQVKPRRTKLGDFRHFRGSHQSIITVNRLLSSDALIFILAHEIAHFIVHSSGNRKTAPHGEIWKTIFGKLLSELLDNSCFSDEYALEINLFSLSPKATVSRKTNLYKMLFPESFEESCLPELASIAEGASFIIPGGKNIYIKQKKRRTRFICKRTDNNRFYLVHQHLKVMLLNN